MSKKITKTLNTKDDEEDQSLSGKISNKIYETKKPFNLFDSDKSRTLDVQELKDATNNLGIDNNGTLIQLFDNIDAKKSGKVNSVEFVNLVKNLEKVVTYLNNSRIKHDQEMLKKYQKELN